MSIIAQIMIMLGIVLSTVYALSGGGTALIITNTISLISSIVSMIMILKYRRTKYIRRKQI
jgi:lipid-A-disaccharide synthase-like uncharacterized protein